MPKYRVLHNQGFPPHAPLFKHGEIIEQLDDESAAKYLTTPKGNGWLEEVEPESPRSDDESSVGAVSGGAESAGAPSGDDEVAIFAE